jgi:omega-6 fatty acid desaturase (delta-12 desaturase)
LQWGYRQIRGWFWWVGSIAHWALLHFDWRQFEGKARQQVKFSSVLVLGTVAIAFPMIIATLGIWGFVKFWLLPWMVYHFWMSTFTLVHHTDPNIPFRPAAIWNEAQAQLAGTVHCTYPRWVEWLCHDINVHVPHHLSTAIPSYNLRRAHQSLRENWSPYLVERQFSLTLMRQIVEHCHLYDDENYYQTFEELNWKSKHRV